MTVSWTRALTRGFNEFFELQLSPAGATIRKIAFDREGREAMTVSFDLNRVDWRVRIETPAETAAQGRGALGRIEIIDGPAKLEGPIDVAIWELLGNTIKAQSIGENHAPDR